MSSTIPMALFFLTGALWIATSIQNHRLLSRFSSAFPEEADKHIPQARSHMRHPEKLFFFVRGASVPILRRDAAIWRMRQRFVFLLALSISLPVVGLAGIAAAAFAFSL